MSKTDSLDARLEDLESLQASAPRLKWAQVTYNYVRLITSRS